MLYRARVVSVPALGRADIVVPKLYGDSVLGDVQSVVPVAENDRVILADLASKAHVHDWCVISLESEIGLLYPPSTHEHSQGDVAGLVDRLAAIEARVAALEP